MIRLIILSIAAFICCNTFSQSYSNNWVFGDSAGLNFSGLFPASFETSILSHEACASISDSLGNLVFYTNGENVWNKNNEVMQNGDSIEIGQLSLGNPSSITQGVVIVPKPCSNNIYYLFQLQNFGLKYSIIDMNLEGGLGDVISKNVEIYSEYLDEKMQVVKHGNGMDYWLLTNFTYETDTSINFISFLITCDSILGPFEQIFAPLPDAGAPGSGISGQMKFSANGNLLVSTRGIYFEIYNFNRCTGLLSEMETILFDEEISGYGLEFSLDGRYLYIVNLPTFSSQNSIYQYCLNCPEPIIDTKQLIYENIYSDHSLGQLQIAADHKIYVPIINNIYSNHEYTEFNSKMSVINYPDINGLSCDFDTLTIPLNSGRSTLSLPNMPNYNLGPLTGSECDTLETALHETVLLKPEFSLYPNPAIDYIIISGKKDITNILMLEIYNMEGTKIFERKNVELNKTISLPSLPPGMYDAVLKQNNMIVFTEKVMIIQQ